MGSAEASSATRRGLLLPAIRVLLGYLIFLFGLIGNVRPLASEPGEHFPFWNQSIVISVVAMGLGSILIGFRRGRIILFHLLIGLFLGSGIRVLTYLLLDYH